jgi:hypothetical protein
MTGPARLENFKSEVSLPVLVEAEHRKGVEESLRYCLIHKLLLHPPQLTFDVEDARR